MSRPARAARMVVAVLATTMLAVAAAGASSADAAPGDIGFEGQSYAPLGGSPTGSKPESKLWFADGVWWSVQFNGAAGEWRIHRLDTAAGLWRDTGVVTDRRDSTRADTIWDGAANKLYVASHIFDTTPQTASAGSSGRLYRFTYDHETETYSLDAGFPVLINAARTETLVVDQDSTGTLWATWVLGNQVWVNHSTSPGGTSWGTPYVIPGTGAVDDDDLSSLVHFGGDRIGVMWSDQATQLFHFAVHADGAGDHAADWSTSSISPGPAGSDDHVNLKAGRDGRVYAAVKTSGSGSQPLILLLVRATDGTWSSHTYGRKSDRLTRPIVVLDEHNHEVHVLVTCPGSANDDGNGENGGDICQKVAPMSDISFAPGRGATVIRDVDAPKMNDATSTKQGLSAASGLVVMANDSHDASRRFWHMQQSLTTGAPQPTPVTAGFTASPTSGDAPLPVAFTDTSSGAPTNWTWSFGDGVISTAQNPTHTYAAAGRYTVTLTASKPGSSDADTKTGHIVVGPEPGPGPGATTGFHAIEDAYVRSGRAARNYGKVTTLRVRTRSSDSYRSLLKFDVTGITGPVTDARLRLYVTDVSPDGGRLYLVDNSWTETGVTWDGAPGISEPPVASIGTTPAAGNWVEVDLGAAIAANGTYSLLLVSSSTNSAIYHSSEGANKPELLITAGTDGAPPLNASFTATPTSGAAPLNVLFNDTSTGDPTRWSWDFGDGTQSNERNPSHTYTTPGTYSVSLTVGRDGAASDTETLTDSVTVAPDDPGPGPDPAPGAQHAFVASADAYVRADAAAKNYGSRATLRVRGVSNVYRSLIRFDVSGVAGDITGAKLRLWLTDASPDSGRVHLIANDWTEGGVSWDSAPPLAAPPLASIGTTTSAQLGSWVEVDVAPAVVGNGAVSFALVSSTTNSALFSSREGSHPPQLIVTTG